MSWFRVDDAFYDHPKVTALMDAETPATFAKALALWTLAGSYCKRHQFSEGTAEGEVTLTRLKRLVPFDPKRAAKALVSCGLWAQTERGFAFVSWSEWQRNADEVIATREKERIKKQRQRGKKAGKTGELSPGDTEGDSRGSPGSNPTQPNPTPEKIPPSSPSEPASGLGPIEPLPADGATGETREVRRALRAAYVEGHSQRFGVAPPIPDVDDPALMPLGPWAVSNAPGVGMTPVEYATEAARGFWSGRRKRPTVQTFARFLPDHAPGLRTHETGPRKRPEELHADRQRLARQLEDARTDLHLARNIADPAKRAREVETAETRLRAIADRYEQARGTAA